MGKHYLEACSDAWDTVQEFADGIIEQVQRGETVSDDLHNDYSGGDEYHHSTHVDKFYTLSEASAVLDDLSEWEEDDTGLWEGLEPRKAIAAQAAYTYGNAVLSKWRDLIGDLNTDLESVDWEPEGENYETEQTAAKVRYCRFWLLLSQEEWTSDTLRSLYTATAAALCVGSVTELLVFADALQEAGEEAQAKELREIASFTLPAETE